MGEQVGFVLEMIDSNDVLVYGIIDVGYGNRIFFGCLISNNCDLVWEKETKKANCSNVSEMI